jgi:hypothetical protein
MRQNLRSARGLVHGDAVVPRSPEPAGRLGCGGGILRTDTVPHILVSLVCKVDLLATAPARPSVEKSSDHLDRQPSRRNIGHYAREARVARLWCATSRWGDDSGGDSAPAGDGCPSANGDRADADDCGYSAVRPRPEAARMESAARQERSYQRYRDPWEREGRPGRPRRRRPAGHGFVDGASLWRLASGAAARISQSVTNLGIA